MAETAPRVWSTASAGAGEGLSYWVDAICEAFLEMKADSIVRRDFAGRLEQHDFGPLNLNFVAADRQDVWRPRQAIARSSRENFYLLHIRSGRLQVSQQDRNCLLQPGDCAMVDSRRPYSFSFPDGVDCLSVQIPTRWLQGWLPAPEEMTAVSLAAGSGWGATLAMMLGNLDGDRIDELPLSRSVIADQMAALLALSAGTGAISGTRHRQALLQQLRCSLRDRLHDPDLDPAAVAATHGLSKRYLHLLFADAASSFGAELLAMRLDRAKTMLADRHFAALGIGEIAWRCGFADPSHFARRFRQRHGLAPAAWRRQLHA